MTSPINAIDNSTIAASYLVSTTTKLLNAVTDISRRRLEAYGFDVEQIETEEEAQAILKQKDAEKAEKIQSQQNGETYYDKQIMADAINLASDLGLYISEDIDIETLMDNIQNRLAELKSAVEGNENLQNVVDEYSSRYDYIYAQYLDKKSTLASQIISSLDVMGSNNIGSVSI